MIVKIGMNLLVNVHTIRSSNMQSLLNLFALFYISRMLFKNVYTTDEFYSSRSYRIMVKWFLLLDVTTHNEHCLRYWNFILFFSCVVRFFPL